MRQQHGSFAVEPARSASRWAAWAGVVAGPLLLLWALTSARLYRGPWPTWRALALIDRESGVKLDPRCVTALHAVIGVPAPLAEYEAALVAHAN